MMAGGAAAAVCFRRRDRGGTVVGIALPLCKRRTRFLPLAPYAGRGWARGLRGTRVFSRCLAPSPKTLTLPLANRYAVTSRVWGERKWSYRTHTSLFA